MRLLLHLIEMRVVVELLLSEMIQNEQFGFRRELLIHILLADGRGGRGAQEGGQPNLVLLPRKYLNQIIYIVEF